MPLDTTKLTVTAIDGAKTTLELRQLSIIGLDKACIRLAESDTPGFVAVCCGRKTEWLDSLSIESFGELTAAAFELNFERAVRYATADPIAGSRMAPMLQNLTSFLKAAQPSVEPSSAWSPAPAPEATAAGIPSAPSIAPSISSSTSSPSTIASKPDATSGISTPPTPPSPAVAMPNA